MCQMFQQINMLKIIAVLSIISLTWASPIEKSPRIIGGSEVDIEKVPYSVALLFLDYFLCGGVILTEKYVLTAASCTGNAPVWSLSVVAGNVHWQETKDVQSSALVEIFVNPDFIPNYSKNGDFAIVQLETPFQFNEKVKCISLASEPAKKDDVGHVSGWGYESYPNGHTSKVLKTVDVTVVDYETCQSIFDKYGYTENMICAGALGVGGKDFCEYDTGAPLVINEKVAGIASWGLECGHPDYPGIYTNVINEKYLKFINDVISN